MSTNKKRYCYTACSYHGSWSGMEKDPSYIVFKFNEKDDPVYYEGQVTDKCVYFSRSGRIKLINTVEKIVATNIEHAIDKEILKELTGGG